MVFPDNTLQFYDVESRQFPSWGKDLSSALPKRLTHSHEPVIGVTFDPTQHSSEKQTRNVLLWGSTWICRLSLSEDRISSRPNKKRRRENAKEPAASHDHEDYKMITHYRPILFLDFLVNGELVVVERPLIDILSTLPPPFFTPKYGAS
jgi:U3 small nucleolar RNA-associated protein 4